MGPGIRKLGALWIILLLAGALFPAPAMATSYSVSEEWTITPKAVAITDIAVSSDFSEYAVGYGGDLYYINASGGVVWNRTLKGMDTLYNGIKTGDTILKSVITTNHVVVAINQTVLLLNRSDGGKAAVPQPEFFTSGYPVTDIAATTVSGSDMWAITTTGGLYVYNEVNDGQIYWGAAPTGTFTSVRFVSSDAFKMVTTTTTGIVQEYHFIGLYPVPPYQKTQLLWINGVGTTLTNYQVHFNVSQAPGCVAVNGTVCVAPNSFITFWDMNFSHSEYSWGGTYLPYWVEENDKYNASVWVKVDTIGTEGTIIRMDYNSTTEAPNSNGPATFPLFFDDFNSVQPNSGPAWNTTRWTWTNGTTGGWFHNDIGLGGWTSSLHTEGNGAVDTWDGPTDQSQAAYGKFYENTAFRVKGCIMGTTYGIAGFTDAATTVHDAYNKGNGSFILWWQDSSVTARTVNNTVYQGSSTLAPTNTCCNYGSNWYTHYLGEIQRRNPNLTVMLWRGESAYGGPYGTFPVGIHNWSLPYLYPNLTSLGTATWYPPYTNLVPVGKPLSVRLGVFNQKGDIQWDWALVRNITSGPGGEPYVASAISKGPFVAGVNFTSPTSRSDAYPWAQLEMFYYAGAQKATGTYVYSMDYDDSLGYLSMSNNTYHINLLYTPGAYGAAGTFTTTNTYLSSSGTPTARVKTSSGASASIEGRGAGIIDIIRLDGTRVGTYTAGGTVNGVDIAHNGLWAVAGSDDGVVYFFSKASSSSWTLLFSTDAGMPVKRVAMEASGAYALAGRSDGSLTKFSLTEAGASPFTQTLHFSKDGSPAANMAVTVLNGGTDQTSWLSVPGSGPLTDGSGNFIFQATHGNYYKVTIDGQESIFQASGEYPTLYFQWTSPPAFPSYGSAYNVTNGTIDSYYHDPIAVPITLEIKDMDTRTLAFCETATSSDYHSSFTPPSGTHHYQMRISAARPMGTIGGVYYATTGTGTNPIQILPLEGPVLQIILITFLMVFMGLFGYVHAPVGAFAVSLIALWFNYETWLTIPWYWVQLCLLVSFFAMLGRGADI